MISQWYPVKSQLGERHCDGKWRIEYNEHATRLRACSNGNAFSDWVNSGLDLDVYRDIAEHVVVTLNKPH